MLIDTTSETLFLFPTPVILDDIDNSKQFNRDLKEIILAHREKDTGVNRSNLGGWHSNYEMAKWAAEPAQILLKRAVELCTKFTADIHPKGSRNFTFTAEMWANINRAGQANQLHCHPGSLWSGVYYVDDGSEPNGGDVEGELVLQDPRYPMNSMYMSNLVLRDQLNRPQNSQYRIKPVNGRLIIFPSWLQHSVRVYNGAKDRISVAFNLNVQPAKQP